MTLVCCQCLDDAGCWMVMMMSMDGCRQTTLYPGIRVCKHTDRLNIFPIGSGFYLNRRLDDGPMQMWECIKKARKGSKVFGELLVLSMIVVAMLRTHLMFAALVNILPAFDLEMMIITWVFDQLQVWSGVECFSLCGRLGETLFPLAVKCYFGSLFSIRSFRIMSVIFKWFEEKLKI